MNLRQLSKSLHDEKKVLRNGVLLLSFAALLVVLIVKLDVVWGALATAANTIAPVLCGIIVAYILNVFVHFFEDFVFIPLNKRDSKTWKKIRRPLSVVLAYLIVAAVVVFITCFIIPGLIESMSAIAETAQRTVPGYVNSAVKWINEFAKKNDLTFIQDFLKGFDWTSLLSNVTKFTTDFVGSLVNVTVNVASGVFSAVMGFIFSIYMLFGKEKLLRGLKKTMFAYMPKGAAKKVTEVGSIANHVFFSFIKGQLTECAILGTLCYIGMSVLGLHYALLVSSVVALGALIPILGAYIGTIVGVVVLLLVKPLDALIFLIFLLCLQQVEGNLIYPRVVGSSIGLPPVWTMFAVLFWGGVLGIPGILIGTPTTAVIYRLVRSSVSRRLKAKGIDETDPRIAGPIPLPEEETPEQQKLEDI